MSEPRALIERILDERRRADASTLLDLMAEITGDKPEVWSGETLGFGRYHYRYASGQEGEFFKVGSAPRVDNLTFYLMSGLSGFEDILSRLGPHKASKSTVKLRSLQGIDADALGELVSECVRHLDEVEASIGTIPRMSEIPPRKPPSRGEDPEMP